MPRADIVSDLMDELNEMQQYDGYQFGHGHYRRVEAQIRLREADGGLRQIEARHPACRHYWEYR